jgi:hypothetical protein
MATGNTFLLESAWTLNCLISSKLDNAFRCTKPNVELSSSRYFLGLDADVS